MSGTEETFHLTEADVQKAESKASKAHKGDVPAGSDAAMMQVRNRHIDLRFPRLTGHPNTRIHRETNNSFRNSPSSTAQKKTKQP